MIQQTIHDNLSSFNIQHNERTKNVSFFVSILTICLLLYNTNRAFLQVDLIPYLILAFESIYVIWLTLYGFIKKPEYFTHYSTIIGIIIIIISYTFSSASPESKEYSLIMKYWGYLACFVYGATIAQNYDCLSINKYIIIFTIYIPLLAVLLFDNTPQKTFFFPDSNMFTLWGVCCSLLYYMAYEKSENVLRNSIIITILYLLVGTSLGIIVSFVLAGVILNIKRKHFALYLLLTLLFLIVGISIIDIPVFLRIRNTFDIITSLTFDDWKNISDVNLYDLTVANAADNAGGRSDNTSAIWRMQHWILILNADIVNMPQSLPFGLGAGYSIEHFTLVPHNDWLRVFAEFGVVLFSFLLVGVINLYKKIKNSSVAYFLITVVLYFLTENLVENFAMCCVFFFSVGYCYFHRFQH